MLEAKNLDKEITVKKIDNETANVKIFNNDILMAIVGEFNKNLIQIEKLTNTKLFFRGNSITVKGGPPRPLPHDAKYYLSYPSQGLQASSNKIVENSMVLEGYQPC